jgi:hypothetical protein
MYKTWPWTRFGSSEESGRFQERGGAAECRWCLELFHGPDCAHNMEAARAHVTRPGPSWREHGGRSAQLGPNRRILKEKGQTIACGRPGGVGESWVYCGDGVWRMVSLFPGSPMTSSRSSPPACLGIHHNSLTTHTVSFAPATNHPVSTELHLHHLTSWTSSCSFEVRNTWSLHLRDSLHSCTIIHGAQWAP